MKSYQVQYDEFQKLQTLWKAVVAQSIIDLKSFSQKRISNYYRIKARVWINYNKDFFQVCNYADLNPHRVFEVKQEIIKKSPLL